MYSKLPNLTIGFHACDQETYAQVIQNNGNLNASHNDYDWLGPGVYFWENNLSRAQDYAAELRKRGRIHQEAVMGAVIDLGRCLNLLETEYLGIVKQGYAILESRCKAAGIELPKNTSGGSKTDLLVRRLDCAVIQTVHSYMNEEKQIVFDSVRGVFVEGGELYPTAGFHEKNHIQICVLNQNCIKGYFSPRELDNRWPKP